LDEFTAYPTPTIPNQNHKLTKIRESNPVKKSQITIRLGAAYDTVTVDGHEFDRATMTRPERHKFRRMLVDGVRQTWEPPVRA
jgi:hypothetical protein